MFFFCFVFVGIAGFLAAPLSRRQQAVQVQDQQSVWLWPLPGMSFTPRSPSGHLSSGPLHFGMGRMKFGFISSSIVIPYLFPGCERDGPHALQNSRPSEDQCELL